MGMLGGDSGVVADLRLDLNKTDRRTLPSIPPDVLRAQAQFGEPDFARLERRSRGE